MEKYHDDRRDVSTGCPNRRTRAVDRPLPVGVRRGSEPPETPESITFDDVTGTDFVTLAEEPGEEFVLGAVGTFWTPDIEWVDVDPGEFAAFDRPGYARLAIGISVRPYGAEPRHLRGANRDDRRDVPAPLQALLDSLPDDVSVANP